MVEATTLVAQIALLNAIEKTPEDATTHLTQEANYLSAQASEDSHE